MFMSLIIQNLLCFMVRFGIRRDEFRDEVHYGSTRLTRKNFEEAQAMLNRLLPEAILIETQPVGGYDPLGPEEVWAELKLPDKLLQDLEKVMEKSTIS